MRRVTTAIVAALVVVTVASALAWAAGTPSISFKSGGPHTITAPKLGCTKHSSVGKMNFTLRVSGMRMSSAMKTKKAKPGQGHVQVYIDKVPADATRRFDKSHWIQSTPLSSFPVCLPRPFLANKQGKHTLYFELGKTNSSLYSSKPATFTFTAKWK